MASRQKMAMTKTVIGLTAMHMGAIVWVQPLREFSNEALASFDKQKEFNSSRSLSHLQHAPTIVRRLALDVVDPLWTNAIFDTICEALGIRKKMGSSGSRAAAMVMYLFAFKVDDMQEKLMGLKGDTA